MFLIQYQSHSINLQHSNQQLLSFYSKFFQKINFLHIIQNTPQLLLATYTSTNYPIIINTKIIHHPNLTFKLQSSLNLFSKKNTFKHTFLKILLIKMFLQSNLHLKLFFYKIYPNNAQIIIQTSFLIQNQTQNLNFTNQWLIDSFFKIIQTICSQFYKLLVQIYEIMPQQVKAYPSDLQQTIKLTKYIKNSTYYTWNFLSHNGQFNNNCYLSQKNKLQLIPQFGLYENLLKKIDFKRKIYENIPKIISNQQDTQLKMRFLNNAIMRNIGDLITDIIINPDYLQKVSKFKQKQIKIHTKQDSILLKIQCFPKSFEKKLKYQKLILQKLPQNQFPGIAKYYYIQNEEVYSSFMRITNLANSICFEKFMIKNFQTISLHTKIYLLCQIAMTLKYLRDNNIVFLNLSPKNIFLKRGLTAKMVNFTNAYHKDLKNETLSKLPYVIKNNSQMSQCELSDVSSFGCLFFYTLYLRQPLKIRQSNLYLDSEKRFYQKLNNCKFCFEKNEIVKIPIFNLITKFSLESYKSDLKQRPYMDWIVIIIKYLQIYSQIHLI